MAFLISLIFQRYCVTNLHWETENIHMYYSFWNWLSGYNLDFTAQIIPKYRNGRESEPLKKHITIYSSDCLISCCTVPKMQNIYSQNWNCMALFPVWLLWAIYIFPGSVIGRPILGIYKSLTETWMWNIGRQNIIKHCNSVLEITRPCSFISGNTHIRTRHLY